VRVRALADVVNLAVVVGGIATGMGSVVGLAKAGVLRRLGVTSLSRSAGRRIGTYLQPHMQRVAARAPDDRGRRSLRTRAGLEVFGIATALLSRNTRGPGWRLLGLRRVDARTGGPVGIRAALIGLAVRRARRELLKRALAPIQRRSTERQAAVAPLVKAAQREHRDDQQAMSEAMMATYREHGVNPLASGAAPLAMYLAGAVLIDAPALWLTGRTLGDLLAGTVVVIDR